MPTCPVCGYPELEEPPRSSNGGGSYEICPSCGFQFGVDDDDKGITFEAWREKWAAKGHPWSSRGTPAPRGWEAEKQLESVMGTSDAKKAKGVTSAKQTRKTADKKVSGAAAVTKKVSKSAPKKIAPRKK